MSWRRIRKRTGIRFSSAVTADLIPLRGILGFLKCCAKMAFAKTA